MPGFYYFVPPTNAPMSHPHPFGQPFYGPINPDAQNGMLDPALRPRWINGHIADPAAMCWGCGPVLTCGVRAISDHTDLVHPPFPCVTNAQWTASTGFRIVGPAATKTYTKTTVFGTKDYVGIPATGLIDFVRCGQYYPGVDALVLFRYDPPHSNQPVYPTISYDSSLVTWSWRTVDATDYGPIGSTIVAHLV